jgi:hypothetical protein
METNFDLQLSGQRSGCMSPKKVLCSRRRLTEERADRYAIRYAFRPNAGLNQSFAQNPASPLS